MAETGLAGEEYDISGIRVRFESSVANVRAMVADTYEGFRSTTSGTQSVVVRLQQRDSHFLLSDSVDGHVTVLADENAALLETLGRISALIVRCLAEAGTFIIHAGVVVAAEKALIMSGPSGSGKTTLSMALTARGMPLLSDEMAVIPPSGCRILPYRRSLHVRPGTPELVGGFDFLAEWPQAQLGAGNRWSLTPSELQRVLPGSLGEARPLGYVLVLDRRLPGPRPARLEPLANALAVVELARETPALEGHMQAVLGRLSGLLEGVRCGRLTMGPLDDVLDLVTAWIDDG